MQVAINYPWLCLESRKLFKTLLLIKDTMITLNGNDNMNKFKPGCIKIFLDVISLNIASFVFCYCHFSEICMIVDNVGLNTTLSLVLKCSITLSFVLSSTTMIFLDSIIIYAFKHIEGQLKILNVLVKEIPIVPDSNDRNYNEEIRKRLNICIQLNLNIKR